MVLAVLLIKTEADMWGCVEGGGLTTLFLPIYYRKCTKLACISVQTKVFRGANHPRQPQNLESLLHLNLKGTCPGLK